MITSMCSNFSPVSRFLTINTAFERGDLPLSSTYHYVHTLYVQPVEVRKRLCNNRGHPQYFTGSLFDDTILTTTFPPLSSPRQESIPDVPKDVKS